MIKVNFKQAKKQSESYIEELFNKGRRHIWHSVVNEQYSVISRSEMRRIAGMMLKEDKTAVDLSFKNRFTQIKAKMSDWLISDDPWDERDLLNMLAEALIECYSDDIQAILDHKDRELAHFENNEVRYG